jgi:hypothetical protein
MDVDLDCVPHGRGRLLGPELLDQTLDRNGLVRVEEEMGKEGALLGGAENDRRSIQVRL